MRFLVVTGLSGAGKTSVNRYLEDMGAFCVDNLPPNMMFRMMEAIEKSALHAPSLRWRWTCAAANSSMQNRSAT